MTVSNKNGDQITVNTTDFTLSVLVYLNVVNVEADVDPWIQVRHVLSCSPLTTLFMRRSSRHSAQSMLSRLAWMGVVTMRPIQSLLVR